MQDTKKEKVTKSLSVKIPTTPNFIFVGGFAYPIKSFTEGELKEIGKAWTEELVLKSKNY